MKGLKEKLLSEIQDNIKDDKGSFNFDGKEIKYKKIDAFVYEGTIVVDKITRNFKYDGYFNRLKITNKE